MSTLFSVLPNSDNLLRRAACQEAQVIPFKVIKLDENLPLILVVQSSWDFPNGPSPRDKPYNDAICVHLLKVPKGGWGLQLDYYTFHALTAVAMDGAVLSLG